MSIVGIIANPAAGKDIRRMVAQGRFVPNHEKVNILRRVLAGLKATGTKRVVMMPDSAMLCRAAIEGSPPELETDILDMIFFNEEEDSTKAAGIMVEMGVGAIVTLGGDGTNRAVSKGSRGVPLVPISTGTNNVFPIMVEGTVAGLAAGIIASKMVDESSVTKKCTSLEIYVDGKLKDIALVDVAISKERFVGARAIWDLSTLNELFLARSIPTGIGLSSIGFRLFPEMGEMQGLHMVFGSGGPVVSAPIAPGLIQQVSIKNWNPMNIGELIGIDRAYYTIAMDGERSVMANPENVVEVVLNENGPTVVSVEATIETASTLGLFTKL